MQSRKFARQFAALTVHCATAMLCCSAYLLHGPWCRPSALPDGRRSSAPLASEFAGQRTSGSRSCQTPGAIDKGRAVPMPDLERKRCWKPRPKGQPSSLESSESCRWQMRGHARQGLARAGPHPRIAVRGRRVRVGAFGREHSETGHRIGRIAERLREGLELPVGRPGRRHDPYQLAQLGHLSQRRVVVRRQLG